MLTKYLKIRLIIISSLTMFFISCSFSQRVDNEKIAKELSDIIIKKERKNKDRIKENSLHIQIFKINDNSFRAYISSHHILPKKTNLIIKKFYSNDVQCYLYLEPV